MSGAYNKLIRISIILCLFVFTMLCWFNLEYIIIVATTNMQEFVFSILSIATKSIGLTTIFVTFFNKWLWRWKLFKFLAGDMPVLAEKYKGKLRFEYNGKVQERDSCIFIKQTFLSIFIRLETDESCSNSLTAVINEYNSSKSLIYTYLNTPRAEILDRSAIHFGTAMLNIDEDQETLSGNYFTIRNSRGSMKFYVKD